MDLEKELFTYQPPKKKENKQMIYNFMFDLRNIIVLRAFGTDNYIYVKYDKT